MDRLVALMDYAGLLSKFMDSCFGDQKEAIYTKFLAVCKEIDSELRIKAEE